MSGYIAAGGVADVGGTGEGTVTPPLGAVVEFSPGVVTFKPVAVVGTVEAPGAGVAVVVLSADVLGMVAVVICVDSAGVGGVPVILPVAMVGMVSALGTCTF